MRHTRLSRSLVLVALLPAVAGLLLGNVALLVLAGGLVLVLVRVREGAQEEGSVDLDVGADRVQRSSPIGLGLEATLGEGPYVGIVHQPLPDTFLRVENANLGLVEPGQTLTEHLTVASPRRGVFELAPARLDRVHPLLAGPAQTLARGSRRELTVETVARPLRTVQGLRGPADHGVGEDPASRGPASTEFEELREYHEGDPLKFVNWKATAKRSTDETQLIVNEYEPEARKNVWFFLDVGRHLEVGSTLDTALEDAIDITLALVHHFTQRGHRVGGTTFNTEPPDTFYPDAGSRQELIIARSLARVEAGSAEEGLAAAVERVKGFLSREEPLVFVVTRPEAHTEDLLEGVRRVQTHASTARRPVPVHVLAPEPPTSRPEEALAQALQVEEARQVLGERGASVLRVHRLADGAEGLERALAKGVMAR
jgi:uncharacterized protein (DUF58 family)